MSIIVKFSPTGLMLASEAKKDPNFDWKEYLQVNPILRPDGDQLLTHNQLYLAWSTWLVDQFGEEDGNRIDASLDPILANNSWSPTDGISGTLELEETLYNQVLEKINIPIDSDMMNLSISA